MKLAKRLQGVVKVLSALPIGVTIQAPDGYLMFANKIALQKSQAVSLDDFNRKLAKGYYKNVKYITEDGQPLDPSQLPGRIAMVKRVQNEKLILYKFPNSKNSYWAMVKASPIISDDGSLLAVINIVDDYTKIKKDHDTILLFNRILSYVSSTISFDKRLQRVTDSVVPIFSDWCAIDILEGKKIVRVSVAHTDPKKVALAWDLVRKYPQRIDDSGGVSQVIRTGEAMFIPKITQKIYEQIKDEQLKELLISLNLRSVVIAPITSRQKVIGAITFVWSDSGRTYKKSDFSLLKSLTSQISILADNAKLFSKTKQNLIREKELSRENEENRQTLNIALEAGGMSVWEWDSVSNFLTWGGNPGLDISPFQGSISKFLEIIHNDDRKVVEGTFKTIKKLLDDVLVTFRLRDQTGKFHWIKVQGQLLLDENGKPSRIVGVWSDITESKTSQDRIAESEKKFKAVVESALDSIILYNNKTMEIIDVNASASTLLGKKRKRLVGLKIDSLLERSFKDSRGEVNLKGVPKTVEYTQSPNFMTDMNLLFLRDITERKIEEKRREHFLGIASHELKNPIASIKAYVEIIKRTEGTKDNQKILGYLENINERSDMLTKIINDLLDVTRIRQSRLLLSYEFFDLDSLIKDFIIVAKLSFSTHKIFYDSPGKFEILADKTRVVQVINNLVKNAVKYSPDSKKVEIRLKKESQKVVLSIIDFGIGINKEDKKRIFELYRRGTEMNKIEGLGVGLYISHQIVKQHGGNIQVKSEPNKGSEFVVILPLTPKKNFKQKLSL